MAHREELRKKITELFSDVGDCLGRRVYEMDIHQEHDVHAFYRLSSDPSKVIHVQGYPGLSSEKEARICADLMDYEMAQELRAKGRSIGNEHEAELKHLTDRSTTEVPYDSEALAALLEGRCEELRRRR